MISTLLWRVVLHSLADEFLHLVADDNVPTFNYVVDDLDQYLYTNSAGDAQEDGRDDARYDAQDDSRNDAQDDARDDDARDDSRDDAQDDAR